LSAFAQFVQTNARDVFEQNHARLQADDDRVSTASMERKSQSDEGAQLHVGRGVFVLQKLVRKKEGLFFFCLI